MSRDAPLATLRAAMQSWAGEAADDGRVTGPSLSVIVPMWNEADGLGRLAEEVLAAGGRLQASGAIGSFELILVDDGSTDSTETAARAWVERDPHIRLVVHGENRGLGAAVRSGIQHASGDLVLYTDADLPADLTAIDIALALCDDEPTAVVSAYRLSRRPDGWRRFVYSFVYNALVEVLFHLEVRDVNFAFKLLPADAVHGMGLRSEGSFIDVELLARATKQGIPIRQFGVEYHPRLSGRSTLSSVPVILEILRELRSQRRELQGDDGAGTAP